jgi:hypothetical protein
VRRDPRREEGREAGRWRAREEEEQQEQQEFYLRSKTHKARANEREERVGCSQQQIFGASKLNFNLIESGLSSVSCCKSLGDCVGAEGEERRSEAVCGIENTRVAWELAR